MKINMERIQYEILIKILSIIARKSMAIQAIEHPVRKNQLPQIKRVFKKYSIDVKEIFNHRIFTFSPGKIRKNLHIIYFHGGAYIWQGELIHWLFLRNLMRRLGCRASYLEYPLAPEYGYTDTFNMVQHAYENLVKVFPHDKFVFMGDSAGAGLAFAFAQKLNKDKSRTQPQKIILLSPWLDVSLANPDIAQIATQDPLLSVEALSLAADLYARGADKSDYLLSPINGEIEGLGEVHLLIGTRDILWPDCLKFFENAKKINRDVYLYEYKNMPHIWMFFPFRQTKDAIARIMNILTETNE